MKALIEFDGVKHVMEIEQAAEIVELISKYSSEIYRQEWQRGDNPDIHRVYERGPDEGKQRLELLTPELYAMGKLAGKGE